MSSNLPPLQLDTEVAEFSAYKETTEVSMKKCNHKGVKYINGELRCLCGSAWSGPGLDRLYKALISQ